uniref:Uncharacterized protein n=1 Tax=Anguilla anguilla TaxID=7936 RepID=A0A0E9PKK5_ANGAN
MPQCICNCNYVSQICSKLKQPALSL